MPQPQTRHSLPPHEKQAKELGRKDFCEIFQFGLGAKF
jgi:hypothetical protein